MGQWDVLYSIATTEKNAQKGTRYFISCQYEISSL